MIVNHIMLNPFKRFVRMLFFTIYLSVLLPSLLYSQTQSIKFEKIGSRKGLSQASIHCIYQDSRGFIWIGTESGINRYDGYDFIVYTPDAKDPRSLSNNWVYTVYEDRTGNLWIGTDNGLNRFNREKETFTHYFHDPEKPNSISSNRVFTIFEDRSGRLWIGTDNGLNRFNREDESFKRYRHDPENSQSLSDNRIHAIIEDHSNVLWIGTDNGLNRFDPEEERWVRFFHDPNDPNSLSSNNINSICEDSSGRLWIGTDKGLNLYYPATGKFIRYFHDPEDSRSLSDDWIHVVYQDHLGTIWIGTNEGGLNRLERNGKGFVCYKNDSTDPYSLSSNRIYSLYEDRSGVIWVGTYGGALCKFIREPKPFVHITHDPKNPNSLSHMFARSFYEERPGIIWIGTDGGGLNIYDRKAKRFTHYRHDPNDPTSLSNDRVFSILKDSSGSYWLGTYGGGVNRFDPESGKFTCYKNSPNDPSSLSDDRVRVICEDHRGVLWIGTDGGGLNRFDTESGKFTRYRYDPDDPSSLSNDRVWSIVKSRSGILWIATFGGGLNRFDPENGSFYHYNFDPDNPNSISNDYCVTLYEDEDGILWIGSNGSGIIKFDPKTEMFSNYSEPEGLAGSAVYGILEDRKGRLWISTNNGLSRFDPETETFRNYDINDGLQDNEFNGGARYMSPDGEMFFGGISGFNSFYPETIKDNPYPPQVVITNFKIFNRVVPIGQDNGLRSPLEKSITVCDKIVLSHKDNMVSFEFAALHYVFPGKNSYAYMMEGVDKEWVYTTASKRYASYSNLRPGRYKFKVKASNNDGIWNEKGTEVEIVIIPPFWQRLWFRILSFAIFILLILGIYEARALGIKRRNRELEEKVRERTRELESVNNELKDFAYIVSHDLKAPLRGISQLATWISQDYGNRLDDEGREQIDLLLSRVKRMENLINGVLQYSRAGREREEKRDVDCQRIVEEVIDSISPPDNINIRIENRLPTVYAEPVKIQQIFLNLISNAVKYNNKKRGKIRIGCMEDNGYWKFSVSDNGPGIDEKYYDRIFKIFQTLESRDRKESTGVGLSVVKKIIEQYGGRIWVESEIGKGSTFYFSIKKVRVK